MAKKKSPKKKATSLTDAAREIGSRLGEVHVKASRMVDGVKAAVKASTESYKGKPSAKKRPSSAKKK